MRSPFLRMHLRSVVPIPTLALAQECISAPLRLHRNLNSVHLRLSHCTLLLTVQDLPSSPRQHIACWLVLPRLFRLPLFARLLLFLLLCPTCSSIHLFSDRTLLQLSQQVCVPSAFSLISGRRFVVFGVLCLRSVSCTVN